MFVVAMEVVLFGLVWYGTGSEFSQNRFSDKITVLDWRVIDEGPDLDLTINLESDELFVLDPANLDHHLILLNDPFEKYFP